MLLCSLQNVAVMHKLIVLQPVVVLLAGNIFVPNFLARTVIYCQILPLDSSTLVFP